MEGGVTNITHKQAKLAELTVTGKRFCTQCQAYKDASKGKIKITGTTNKPVKRWQCEVYANKMQNKHWAAE